MSQDTYNEGMRSIIERFRQVIGTPDASLAEIREVGDGTVMLYVPPRRREVPGGMPASRVQSGAAVFMENVDGVMRLTLLPLPMDGTQLGSVGVDFPEVAVRLPDSVRTERNLHDRSHLGDTLNLGPEFRFEIGVDDVRGIRNARVVTPIGDWGVDLTVGITDMDAERCADGAVRGPITVRVYTQSLEDYCHLSTDTSGGDCAEITAEWCLPEDADAEE